MKAKITETEKKKPTFKDIPIGGLFCERLTGSPYMRIQEEDSKNAVQLEYGYLSNFEADAEVIKVVDYKLEVLI